jgi:competence protein ComEC
MLPRLRRWRSDETSANAATMKKLAALGSCMLAMAVGVGAARAGSADKKLDVYWIDVEGGAATLLVTPAGESVLVDSGYPGGRDARRVAAAAQQAGLKKIDHMIVTHFHIDHFGAVPEIAKLIPIGTLYDHDVATAPDEERKDELLKAYAAVKVDKRVVVKPGDMLPLKQAPGTAPLSLQFLGAVEKFATPKKPRDNDARCKESTPRPIDASDNKNSIVMLTTLGPFRFFDGGDLTWNTENALVCPNDRVGPVDVYQTDHHGLDVSNNPVLVKTLEPSVVVVNNGPRKGGEPGTLATAKATASVKAVYQVHRNVRVGPDQNTAPELIANAEENCKGNGVKMSVDGNGKRYTLTVPATNHAKTYETRGQ